MTWFAMCRMKCTSWLIKINVPEYCWSASISESMLGMSRCVVGSSISSRLGGSINSFASASRLFSPPLNTRTGLNTSSPLKRKLPSSVRTFSSVKPVGRDTPNASASTVAFRSIVSARYCEK